MNGSMILNIVKTKVLPYKYENISNGISIKFSWSYFRY